MKRNKLLSLLLALALAFSLAACANNDQPTESSTPPETTLPVESEMPSTEPDSSEAVTTRVTVLNGPTGVGASKLLSDIDAGTAAQDYTYNIAATNDELTAMLSNGETDIATMASNTALNYYNKTDGSITTIALGTLGVLHILESGGGTSIQSVADLAGKTILAPGQGSNPEYILRYVLSENGVDPDTDVTLEFYTDASEITAKLLSGEAECAMLPVPAATAAIAKSEGSVRAALDMTEEWDALNTGSQLIMTAVVVRTQFLEEHPEAVDAFLEEYAASIAYVNENVEEAAELVAGYGFAPSAAIAAQAIPQCHLVCITGADMQPAIDGYYAVLFEANPDSIGGSRPDDAFYYVP